MSVVSIQSHVVYGHVGNRAAVFPLELVGHEVWPINTVQLSNHRGYDSCMGEVFTGGHIELLWSGIKALGLLPECDALLSGYLGSVEIGASMVAAVADIKAVNPSALYCCDPVMGDYGKGMYVEPGLPEFLAESALGWADIVTPNQFEAEYLSGIVIDSLDSARSACDLIRAKGPRIVLITGFKPRVADASTISMFMASEAGYHTISTPELPLDPAPHGAGDLCAALFLGRYLVRRDAVKALELCSNALYSVMLRSQFARSRELKLIESRDDILKPKNRFRARRIR
ncbi:MAG TPA: pyridoxal kinase PdxY [Rectinemataceae bacterium]|nr:pyridoxal kinase PdxY [Rectinemataceae bacterium]